jgi:hydrogenase nickel incorporation protein HypA/HybF
MMHELSIVMGLCDQLQHLVRQQGAHRVHSLLIEVGALSNVVPDLLEQAFEALRSEVQIVERAELEIRALPLRIRCLDCGEETEPEQFRFVCPECRSFSVETLQGEELLLRRVELEIDEEGRNDDHSAAPRSGESAQVE